MKMAICDICFYKENEKIEKATRRVGFKGRNSIKVDTCEKHQDIMKDKEITFENQFEWYMNLSVRKAKVKED